MGCQSDILISMRWLNESNITHLIKLMMIMLAMSLKRDDGEIPEIP